MVFLINILSKIPFIDTTSIEGIVQHNRLIFIIGLTIYGILGAIIYYKHLPEPYNKYLNHYTILILALVDVVLYCVLHKMNYGVFPPLTVPIGSGSYPGPRPSGQVECIDGVCKRNSDTSKIDVDNKTVAETKIDTTVETAKAEPSTSDFKPPAPPINEDLNNMETHIDEKVVQETSKYDNRFFEEDEDVIIENWESNDQANSELNFEFEPDPDDSTSDE